MYFIIIDLCEFSEFFFMYCNVTKGGGYSCFWAVSACYYVIKAYLIHVF